METGDSAIIGGFIIGAGSSNGGAGSEKVYLRGIGPSLAAAGVGNPLQDPTLELRDGNGTLLAANDNWTDAQQSEIQATGIPPSDGREAAIVRVVPSGAYTAILSGKDTTTGVGLLEVYNLP